MRLTGAVLLALLLATPLRAQAPYLVSDINPTPSPDSAERDPKDLEATPSALYFVGFDLSNGREIHRLSGSSQLTLAIDLAPGPGSANTVPQRLAAAGDIVYFEFDDGIYRTDGTAAGTTLLRQFGPDYVELLQLTGVGSGVFFVEQTNLGDALWWSDGTPAGTVPLLTGEPESLTSAGGRLFFSAEDASGHELWTSDGTVAGTVRVKDICPGTCSGLIFQPDLADVEGTLYFLGNDGVNGRELWKSDGTAAGTVMIADVLPSGQGFFEVTAFGSLVLTASNDELWRSDGTAAGTFRLRSGITIRQIHDAGGLAFFDGEEDATGRELWKTDGTAAGTALVVDACAGTCSFFVSDPAMGSVPGVLLFTRFDGTLWRSDGTAAGTFLVRSYDTTPPSFTRFAGLAYFGAHDGESGRELWRSDGTTAGTQMVHNAVDSSSWPVWLGHAGDRLFASASRAGQGRELWSTTGTPASSTFVELVPGTEDNIFTASHDLGDRLVFGTFTTNGTRLWTSDGSPAGTSLLASGVATSHMGSARDLVFFDGSYPPGNREPWRTDGTPGGTFGLEIGPGVTGSHPDRFVAFRDRIWFRSFAPADYVVWQSDGTTAGTSMAIPLPCLPMVAVADTLYLQCLDVSTGFELWASDGTASGTRPVKDIVPGPESGFVGETAELGGILYFVADDETSGAELWRSDGTEAGTYRVRDIQPGPSGSLPMQLTTLGGVLYFAAETAAAGYELWRSDGTEAGTVMVRDLNPGPGQGVFDVEAAGGQLLLSAYTAARGIEPWISDGSDAGTLPLPEIAPGPSSSWPIGLQAVAGRIYFTANDGVTGLEPWAVTMPAGAVSVGDALVQEGDAGTHDVAFEVRLESASSSAVQVAYTTVAGTAQAGVDYEPRSGVLTFLPGATSETVGVPVIGDLADETDETFRLDLSPVGNAVIADPTGIAVILDDDGPFATMPGASVAEGNAGSTSAAFTVTLTTRDGTATPNAKTIGFATAPATATPGLDYVDSAGTLTFPAGSASGTTVAIQVPILGDVVDEPDETFRVFLSSTSDVSVPPAPATGVILDDDGIDAAPAVELAHGSVARATLEPPAGRTSDRDWYVLAQQPYASYEVLVDETSGDAVPLQVDRMAADGSTVLQSASVQGTGASVSLRWENAGSVAIANEPIRIGSAACGTSCGVDDVYRVRLYETTLSAPRINNTGTQVTVVIVQNATDKAIAGRLNFWTSFGVPVNFTPFQLSPRQVLVLNTSTVFGGSGTLTVTHDGPYGALVGKAVALEPATGFSFDTPMSYRPR